MYNFKIRFNQSISQVNSQTLFKVPERLQMQLSLGNKIIDLHVDPPKKTYRLNAQECVVFLMASSNPLT